MKKTRDIDMKTINRIAKREHDKREARRRMGEDVVGPEHD